MIMFIDVVEALARVVAEVVKGLAKGLASAVLHLRSEATLKSPSVENSTAAVETPTPKRSGARRGR
jgi:hypothetical protein